MATNAEKIKQLKAVVDAKNLPEAVRKKAADKIKVLEAEEKPKKIPKPDEKKPSKKPKTKFSIEKQIEIADQLEEADILVQDELSIEGWDQLIKSLDLQKKYKKALDKKVPKILKSQKVTQEMVGSIEGGNRHEMIVYLSLSGHMASDVRKGYLPETYKKLYKEEPTEWFDPSVYAKEKKPAMKPKEPTEEECEQAILEYIDRMEAKKKRERKTSAKESDRKSVTSDFKGRAVAWVKSTIKYQKKNDKINISEIETFAKKLREALVYTKKAFGNIKSDSFIKEFDKEVKQLVDALKKEANK